MKPEPASQMTLEQLRELVARGKYHYSTHALEKKAMLRVQDSDVAAIALSGELLERYTEDARGWSYLLLGFADGHPLHLQLGFNYWRNLAIIITVYEPVPPRWITPRQRGERNV
jgi:hypothetical protein